MLRDELDMLECRLRELDGSPVYRHVLVESPVTHRGVPKPLYYADNRERFAPWADRIIHVIAQPPDPVPPSCPGCGRGEPAWVLEHAQRNHVWPALEQAGAQPEDVVLLCDVDEFPPAEAFTRLPEPVLACRQNLCMYAADWLYPQQMLCSVTARFGWARDRDASAVRDSREHWPSVNGGWHITWLGGTEGQREKLRTATCHLEMTAGEYDRIYSGACYERGEHHSGTLMMTPVDVDSSWPRWIFERQCPPSWFRPRP